MRPTTASATSETTRVTCSSQSTTPMTTLTQTLAWCTSCAELAHSAHSLMSTHTSLAQVLSLVISHPRSYPWAHLLDSPLPFYFHLFFPVFSIYLLHSELYPELDNPIVSVTDGGCKEYTSYFRKLATKTENLQPEQQHEHRGQA